MVNNKTVNQIGIAVAISLFIVAFWLLAIQGILINRRISTIERNLQIKIVEMKTNSIKDKASILQALADVGWDILDIQRTLGINDGDVKDLKKRTFIDTDKMLNGSVFVRGIFGLGSGTVLKKDADGMYILSCYHVVSDVIDFTAPGEPAIATIGYVKDDRTGKAQGETIYAAEVIKADKENDLVLLKTSIVDNDLAVINVATEEPIQGDVIYSVGNPLGVMRTLSRGILANHKEGFYMSDNTTTYGNSGGSLYNIKAELIGVPSNVLGYSIDVGENDQQFVPETGLGLSIDLLRIKIFLEGEL